MSDLLDSNMWVLDVSGWDEEHPHRVWCPIEDDGTVVNGLMVMSDVPPRGGRCVAIYHEAGQEEVETWMEGHAAFLETLHADLRAAGVAE